MKCAFCCLDTNKKTYQAVLDYAEIIRKGVSTYKLDLDIQRREIECYLKKNGLGMEDRLAITQWIQANSEKFRSYLNSVKLVALSLHFIQNSKNTADFDFESFRLVVKTWNSQKSEILDSLFI